MGWIGEHEGARVARMIGGSAALVASAIGALVLLGRPEPAVVLEDRLEDGLEPA